MYWRAFSTTFVLVTFLSSGCNNSAPADTEATRKAAEEQALREKEKAEREQVQRDKAKLLAENGVREELKNDFELLLGHWDHPAGKSQDGKLLPAIHLEITVQHQARFHMVAGLADSTTECPIALIRDEEKRLIVQSDGASQLKLTPLAYRLDGDQLTLQGSATDVLLKDVDLSGVWRRTDWTKKTEPEIVDALKKLDAHVVYDENNPANPIVQVTFIFQAPVHNEQLRILAGLKRLQELDLSEAANLTDAGLKHLAPLKQLKQVNLRGLSLSNEAVQELREQLPNCELIR